VGSTNQLGTVVLPVNSGENQELLRPVITGNSEPLKCLATRWNAAFTRLTITYSMGAALLHVTVQSVASATGFQVELAADQPGITSVDMGNWEDSLDTKPIPVPYYMVMSGMRAASPNLLIPGGTGVRHEPQR